MKKLLLALILLSSSPSWAYDDFTSGFNLGSQLGNNIFGPQQSRREQEAEFARQKELILLNHNLTQLEEINSDIRLNPEDADLYFQRGNLWRYKLKDWSQATDDYMKAIEYNPNHLDAAIELAGLLYKGSNLDTKYAQLVVNILQPVLKGNPAHPNAYKADYMLAQAYEKLGRKEIAFEFANNSVGLNPACKECLTIQKRLRPKQVK